MLGRGFGGRWLALLAAGLAVVISAAMASPAHARRHALLVGVDKYKKEFGIEPLKSGGNDADAMGQLLSQHGINFDVVVVKDEKVRDKAAFNAELNRFLDGVAEDDEVLFFFSGHGLNIDGRNIYLLTDAKSQAFYLDGKVDGKPNLEPAIRRTLDTKEKQDRSYRDWVLQVGVDEKVLEDAILQRKARVLVIVADACRTLLEGTKSAVVVSSGLSMPKAAAHGVFRLYSASEGQLAYGAPEDLLEPESAPQQSTPQASKAQKGSKKDAQAKDTAGAGKEGPRYTSLFTRVLLSEIPKPYKSFGMLAEAVKHEVYEQSVGLKLGAPQTPDHNQGPGSYGFKFVEDAGDLTAHCRTAQSEYQRLLDGVLQGGVGADVIRRKALELDPCGWGEQVLGLLKFERLGTGFLTGPPVSTPKAPDSSDPFQQCDFLAASPHDRDLPRDTVVGEEITKLALAAISDQTSRERALVQIQRAVTACEAAVRDRPRYERYKFNLGRAYYAMALTDTPVQRPVWLEKASRTLTEAAVDMGHAAAYNFLGQLYLNGEFHEMKGNTIVPVPPDRDMAVKLFKRGAALKDVLASYNLGMAYKNGESGLGMNTVEAYPLFAKAAEEGFVQAMVETAHALLCNCGVAGSSSNEKRAIELLEDAARRGSSEAMLRLGNIFKAKGDKLFWMLDNDGKGLSTVEYNKAVVWYARAAEVGDAVSQEKVADMLTVGLGVPAAQLDAAGRYWRLAAEGGSVNAQLKLADLLRGDKVEPRPQRKGKAEAAAQEIRDLYLSAFARGKPRAGLELARLYRTGYPELLRAGSDAIPKDAEKAVKLLWDVMARVRTAPADSDDANPEHEAWAAFELISMYEAGESRLPDGRRLISEDQFDRLRDDFGSPRDAIYVRISKLGAPVRCAGGPSEFMVLIWNSKRADPPTDRAFDWFERRFRCKVSSDDDATKAGKAAEKADNRTQAKASSRTFEERGISKATRDMFRTEYFNALRDPSGKSYVDRMVELIARGTGTPR